MSAHHKLARKNILQLISNNSITNQKTIILIITDVNLNKVPISRLNMQ